MKNSYTHDNILKFSVWSFLGAQFKSRNTECSTLLPFDESVSSLCVTETQYKWALTPVSDDVTTHHLITIYYSVTSRCYAMNGFLLMS
jgi:hypothetical protein